ncbi:ATP-binding protein [Novipirellula caenicola]|uniref:histidine kinase n=1 Tax=Novipirellula caenicola TaxID=1536901 RepID=A0ABP9VM05_9BACT
MLPISQITAKSLCEGRRALADRIHDRMLSGGPSETNPLRLAAELESHITVLAACIEFTSPRLLEDYIRWAMRLPRSVSPYQWDIRQSFETIRDVVRAHNQRDVGELVSRYVDHSFAASDSRGEPALVPPRPSSRSEFSELRQTYLAALLDSRRKDAVQLIMNAVESGTEIRAIYLHVLQPTQHELGRLWESGKISVAQEHYCTASTQFVMSQIQPYLLNDKITPKSLVATCVGDELHEVGLRIITDLFEVSGWDTVYLGANIPAEAIAESVAANNARVLAISTTMTQHLFGLSEVIAEVRKRPECKDVRILVGGYPFNVDPFLWRRTGADASANDAIDAIEIAERLWGDDQPEIETTLSTNIKHDAATFTEGLTTDDDLSRINNHLVTLQRDLHKANVRLMALNEDNQNKAIELQRASQRKDEFMAMLAHELRGPLAPLTYAASLLQLEPLDANVLQDVRETISRQLQQMTYLINDLLETARVAHGKIELRREKVFFREILNRALEIVRPLVKDKAQNLHIDHTHDLELLDVDIVRLTQVLANLLTNASKYTDEKGSIWVSTSHLRDRFVITVRDNGIGISEETLPDVFSTFTQEQRSKDYAKGGLGLGLSLVKQLIELHGGSVNASSAGPGRGSVFSVSVPVVQPSATADAGGGSLTPDSEIRAAGRTGQRVLVVDDTAGSAKITALLLKKLGFDPHIASDGATAIKRFAELSPQIVLLDLTLPDMSGFSVAQQIRRETALENVLIVALTGHSDQKHRSLATESGFDEYFVKPVDIHVLKRLGDQASQKSAGSGS